MSREECKYLLVQFEDGKINPPKYDIVEESRLVPPPIGEIGELYSGKIVYVGTVNGSRRSKVINMSEDYIALGGGSLQDFVRQNTPDELKNSIKKWQETFKINKPTANTNDNNILINPYENPIPSTSACLDTAKQIALRMRQSLVELLGHFSQYVIKDILDIRQESGVKITNNLVTPATTVKEKSHDISPEQVDLNMERENNENNRQIPRNSSVAGNGPPKEIVNFELNVREEKPRTIRRMKRRNTPQKSSKTVKIGPGRTEVSKRVMRQIDWTSHTMATRNLLMDIFPRKVLATHSLTGKPSPAFLDRPAKLCLDPVRVQDIIVTVCKKCKVKENLVRQAITIKCADEDKMLRTRKAKRKLKKAKKENCDPKNKNSTASSSSSTKSGSSP